MKYLLLIILALVSISCMNSNQMGAAENQFKKAEDDTKNQAHMNFDTTTLTKTAEMLDEGIYWQIIENSLKNTKSQHEQEAYLVREIGKLTPKEMIGFRLRTDKLLYDTYTSDMWCAGYIMNGGCSDDGFEYFRNWVISRGKQAYESAKQHPDYLIHEVTDEMDEYEFESFWYVALTAFKQKTGKNLYDYIDNDKFKTNEGNYPHFEFTWQEENPESMKKICPELFDRFMG